MKKIIYIFAFQYCFISRINFYEKIKVNFDIKLSLVKVVRIKQSIYFQKINHQSGSCNNSDITVFDFIKSI